eukprot:s239_g24.t1
MHVHEHEHVRQQEPAPTLNFDLTADDDDAATDVELGQDDDELRKANAAEQLPNGPIAPSLITRNPAGGVGVYPPYGDAPPWVQDISAGIMGLHNKVDMSRTELAQYGAEIQAQGVRVSHLEAVAHEHTQQILEAQKQIHYYDARIKELDRLQDFEKRLADLEAAKRSLTPPRNMNRGPASPRSPRSSIADSRDEEGGLDIIVGGWTDAKKADAQQEVANMFQSIGMPQAYHDLWAPYSRTNFIKVQLAFEDPNAQIKVRRAKQLQILEKLKSSRFTSGVPGSENNKIWATKSKTREERERVRALVLTKEFLKHLPGHQNRAPIPEQDIEILWNGRLFVHRHQLLGSMDRDGEPAVNDYIISDARGNHIPWYVKSAPFEALTGYPASELGDLWAAHCPSGP